MSSRRFGPAGVDRVVVVAPPPEVEGAESVAALAAEEGAEVVVAEVPTPDMRSSVELGLAHLRPSASPADSILICPADSPGLSAGLVALIVSRHLGAPDRIHVPSLDGRRGHPLVLPWRLAERIFELPADVGVNSLISGHADQVVLIPVADPGALADLDTPSDYERWSALPDRGR